MTQDSIQAVFLDRDGVINRDYPDYVKCWEEFELLPRSLEALKKLKENGLPVFVITNQSCVGRKIVSREMVEEINLRMRRIVEEAGGRIEGVYYCPHTPEDKCACRKPAPGLILNACRDRGLDPKRSVMVGDTARDIQSAIAAGCGGTVLVKTGNGLRAAQELKRNRTPVDHVAEDLLDAVDWIVTQTRDQ